MLYVWIYQACLAPSPQTLKSPLYSRCLSHTNTKFVSRRTPKTLTRLSLNLVPPCIRVFKPWSPLSVSGRETFPLRCLSRLQFVSKSHFDYGVISFRVTEAEKPLGWDKDLSALLIISYQRWIKPHFDFSLFCERVANIAKYPLLPLFRHPADRIMPQVADEENQILKVDFLRFSNI